jgi:tetratricopeptide (TPR) repeat protein
LTQTRKAQEPDPNLPYALGNVGWCHVWKGELTEALAAFLKQRAADPNPWWAGNVGYAYTINGDRAKATQILSELDELAKRRYVTPGARVTICLGLGRKGKGPGLARQVSRGSGSRLLVPQSRSDLRQRAR